MFDVRFQSRAPELGRGQGLSVPPATLPARSPASNECKDPRSSEGAVRLRSGRMNSVQACHEANRLSSVPTTFRGQGYEHREKILHACASTHDRDQMAQFTVDVFGSGDG